ncbi:SCO family protein [Paraburkholderia sp. BR13439]|uniref:SCO family protein n=1 Tax=Paraburkholderia sp. BR13439 TaxID=3236996 RepID=UPI0034CDED5E
MFTGCSSVCPLQGALFSAVQQGIPRLGSQYPLRLISLSIDPLADSPGALRAWLERFDAGPARHAVRPRIGDVEEIRGGPRRPSAVPRPG